MRGRIVDLGESDEVYFPSVSNQMEYFSNLESLKKYPPLPETINSLLNQVGFKLGSDQRKVIERYLKLNVSDGDMTKVVELLYENLNPDHIAPDKLYSMHALFKKFKPPCRNKRELLEFLLENRITIYKYATHHYVRGRDMARVEELVKKWKRNRKSEKYRYPKISAEVPCVSIKEVTDILDIRPSQINTILQKHPELRKFIYASQISGERCIREEEVDTFIKSVQDTEEYKSCLERNRTRVTRPRV